MTYQWFLWSVRFVRIISQAFNDVEIIPTNSKKPMEKGLRTEKLPMILRRYRIPPVTFKTEKLIENWAKTGKLLVQKYQSRKTDNKWIPTIKPDFSIKFSRHLSIECQTVPRHAIQVCINNWSNSVSLANKNLYCCVPAHTWPSDFLEFFRRTLN